MTPPCRAEGVSPDLGDVWKNSPEWESDCEQVLRLKKTGLLAARGHPTTLSCGPILGSCRTQVRPGHVPYCHLQVFTGAAAIGHGTADQRLQSLRKTSSAPIRVSFVFASLIPLTTSLERQPSPLSLSPPERVRSALVLRALSFVDCGAHAELPHARHLLRACCCKQCRIDLAIDASQQKA